MALTYGDFHTYVADHPGTIYRYWVYKRKFTPYELDKKFVDQSEFVDTSASFGVISKLIELPNGDFLIGFTPVNESGDPMEGDILFYLLSEIQLCVRECDQMEGVVE